MTTEAKSAAATAGAKRAVQIGSLALILLALTACASSQQKTPELSRRAQADLQRIVPLSGMP